MSLSKFYLLGAFLLLSAFIVGQLAHPAMAIGGGPYTLMQHSNTTANAGVFRLDTRSGGISYCYVTPNVELLCSKEAH